MDNENISKQDQKLSSKYAQEEPNEMIEEQTKKVPNLLFLGAAVASMVGAAIIMTRERRQSWGTFMGLWAPTFLVLGLYNKMVKVEDELLEQKSFRMNEQLH